MKYVVQYTYQAKSKEEAEMVAAALRLQDGCLDVRIHTWAVAAHFDFDIPEEALPEGCRLVPESVMVFLKRTSR